MKIRREGDEEIFEVDEEECVVIFRSNGAMEAHIPPHEEEDELTEAATAVLLIGVLFSDGEVPAKIRNLLMEYAMDDGSSDNSVAH